MSWKEHINFGEPTYIEHKVGDNTLKFYPISVKTLFKLKAFLGPFGKAIATFTASNQNDQARIGREMNAPYVGDDGKPYKIAQSDKSFALVRDTETTIEAIDPKLAEVREAQRLRAIENITTMLSEEKNLETIAEIVIDSLRFPDRPPPAQEFIREVPVPLMFEFVMGVIHANKGVFAPVGKLLSPIWSQVSKGVVIPKEPAPASQEQESESNPAGKISPTPSPSSPSEATASST